MSFTVKVCNLHHNSRVQIVHFHTYTEAVGCTRFPKYQISVKKYSYSSILVYVEPPSKTNHLGVHNLLWKYAIYNMNAPHRLHTFTVNYVHQCGWFCSVVPNIWMKRQKKTFAAMWMSKCISIALKIQSFKTNQKVQCGLWVKQKNHNKIYLWTKNSMYQNSTRNDNVIGI